MYILYSKKVKLTSNFIYNKVEALFFYFLKGRVIIFLSCTGIIYSDLIYSDCSKCILHTFTHSSIVIYTSEPAEC
jgi:hypothetical protein